MPSLSIYLGYFSVLLGMAQAVPNVTTVQLTGGCPDYPNYDAATGIAGEWELGAYNSDNSSVEGFLDNAQIVRRSGQQGITMGIITIISDNTMPKIAMRCNGATNALEAFSPHGVSGFTWNQVNLTIYPYDALLMWGLGADSTPIEIYNHYLDGVLQDGTFLGQGGVTTWGIQWNPADPDSTIDGLPYWQFRLLGPDSAVPGPDGTSSPLYPDEYETFIKIFA